MGELPKSQITDDVDRPEQQQFPVYTLKKGGERVKVKASQVGWWDAFVIGLKADVIRILLLAGLVIIGQVLLDFGT